MFAFFVLHSVWAEACDEPCNWNRPETQICERWRRKKKTYKRPAEN